jgi:hypothetical protein
MLDYLDRRRVKAKEPKILRRFEISYENTDKESLKFIHQEASVRVKDTLIDHYEISKKSFSLLLLMITISSFIVGFLMSKESHSFEGIAVVGMIALCISIFVIYILWQMNRPINFHAPGRIPKPVMAKKIFNDIKDDDTRYKYLLYQEILQCQAKIELNQHYNSHRLKVLDFIIRLVLISFFALLAITIILLFT